jgi:hypothetical protein
MEDVGKGKEEATRVPARSGEEWGQGRGEPGTQANRHEAREGNGAIACLWSPLEAINQPQSSVCHLCPLQDLILGRIWTQELEERPAKTPGSELPPRLLPVWQ